MDFIVKFPKSEDISIDMKYDSILIVVDKLIKYIYFILYIEIFKAKQVAWIILNKII